MDDRILEILNVFDTLEEVFEHLDITPEEVLIVLLQGGHIEVPSFLELPVIEEEDV